MNSHVGQTFFKSPTLVGILAISHAFFLNSYRVMAPVVHQVPLQVGLQDHQLRKAIQSGQRDLNHSLHRGLPGRVAHLPVLIPILDRGLPCIQVSHITICFTLSGSSDVLNWGCLFVCSLLELFGTFWEMAEEFELEITLWLSITQSFSVVLSETTYCHNWKLSPLCLRLRYRIGRLFCVLPISSESTSRLRCYNVFLRRLYSKLG